MIHSKKQDMQERNERTEKKKRSGKMTKVGIVVCYPGTGFTCKEALFERCTERFSARGYDVVKLDFSHIPFREIETIEEAVNIAQRAVRRQLAGIDFQTYDDVVWISKSLGTILAARSEETFQIKPRHLFLTPLPETLQLIHPDSRVVALVLGTQDRFLSGEALATFCAERNLCCCLIDGVSHSLKDDQSPERTARINEQIAAFCD